MTDSEGIVPHEAEFLLYQAEDGRARVEVRFDGETAWLTQAGLAELFQTTPQNITQHIAAIYAERELEEAPTCKSYLQVHREGSRQVRRRLKHYSLPMILALGYRVRSGRGTQFRQWATARLEEYVIKGFTMDDARLKNPPGPGVPDYFDELLARIRDIRSSEKVFWRKVLQIYATSIDYDSSAAASQRFFATVQNKMHWAAHGHTAAEATTEDYSVVRSGGRTQVRRQLEHVSAVTDAIAERDRQVAALAVPKTLRFTTSAGRRNRDQVGRHLVLTAKLP